MDKKNSEIALGLIGAGEGLLLGRGLEICFGIDQYLLIMLFGILGGTGIALMVWLGSRWGTEKKAKVRLVVAGAVPTLVVFAVYFVWRILPLIKEEIKFSYS
jgi:hypothetical protein